MPNIGLGLGVFGFVALALAAIVAVVYESYSEQGAHGHGSGRGSSNYEKPNTSYSTAYDTLPTRKKKKKGSDIENNICVICQEDIEDTDTATILCKHTFHYTCLQTWHNIGKNECPICRHKLPQLLKM